MRHSSPFKDERRHSSCGGVEYSRFQEPIPVAVNGVNSTVVGDRDVVGLDPDELSIFFVRLVNTQVSFPLSSL